MCELFVLMTAFQLHRFYATEWMMIVNDDHV